MSARRGTLGRVPLIKLLKGVGQERRGIRRPIMTVEVILANVLPPTLPLDATLVA